MERKRLALHPTPREPSGVPRLLSTSRRPRFVSLPRCGVFYKRKARPSTGKRGTTGFALSLALLRRLGRNPQGR